MEKIGFIGVGIMGKPMCRNLMKHGFEVHVFARHPEKVADIVAEGAVLHDCIAGVCEDCSVILTMVGYPVDVEEVYFEKGNLLDRAKPGSYLIDMTTTSPQLAEKIFAEGSKKGLHVMDAPVTGGESGAIAGSLSILVGGEQSDFEACKGILEAMGTNVRYQGKAGCGQHCKMVNQILIAGALSGVCEGLAYAKAKGLDLQSVFDSISTGAAESFQLRCFWPKLMAGDEAPGFFLKHFVKDLKLALIEANRSGLYLDVLSQTLANCQEVEAQGFGDLGSQALMKYYEN